MTEKTNVTIRLDRSNQDFASLKRIVKEMESFKTTRNNEEDAVEQFNDELRKRLAEAGLCR